MAVAAVVVIILLVSLVMPFLLITAGIMLLCKKGACGRQRWGGHSTYRWEQRQAG